MDSRTMKKKRTLTTTAHVPFVGLRDEDSGGRVPKLCSHALFASHSRNCLRKKRRPCASIIGGLKYSLRRILSPLWNSSNVPSYSASDATRTVTIDGLVHEVMGSLCSAQPAQWKQVCNLAKVGTTSRRAVLVIATTHLSRHKMQLVSQRAVRDVLLEHRFELNGCECAVIKSVVGQMETSVQRIPCALLPKIVAWRQRAS
jgi:hypothetical protein